MEAKGGFFNIVLLFILAFLSLTLVVLAAYIFIVVPSSKATTKIVAQEKYNPTPDKLTTLDLVIEKTFFPLKSSGSVADPATGSTPMLQATIQLKYLTKIPNKKYSNIKDTTKVIDDLNGEIQQAFGTYFMGLTKDEALLPDAKEKASKALLKNINNMINVDETDTSKKGDIVFKIIFPYWAPY